MVKVFIPSPNNNKIVFIPKPEKEEEENKVFIPEPFNVLEGSVIDKFDDSGKEIKKGFVKTIKDFFKSDKEDLANQTYNDPILESIAAIEKKYAAKNFTWGNFKEQVLFKSSVGTVRDVSQSTIDLSNYLLKKVPGIDDNVIDVKLPIIPEPDYWGGSFARDLSGFVTAYTGVTKASQIAKIPEATSKFMKSFKILMTGGLAEQFSFSPREKRLSTIVEKYKDGKFSNAVTAYLQAVDTDSEDAARAKMFAEGAILGIPLELLGWAVRGSINKLTTKSIDEGTIPIETKEINSIKVLAKEKIINLSSRIDEINKLKKDLKEAKAIKPKKTTTETVKDGKKIKTTVIDEISATEKTNKIAAIVKKLKPLEIEEKIFESTQSKKALEDIEYKFPKPRTLEGLDVPIDLTTPQLKLKVSKDAANAAADIITAAGYKVNPYLRITEQMADVFHTGKVSDDAIIRILKKHNLTQEKFAKIFLNNFSDAGRTLQVASTIAKKMNQLRKIDGAEDAWKKNLKDYNPDALDRSGTMIKRLDNVKRGLLVTQLATAMRNFESQTMRQGLAVMEESLDKAFQVVFKSLAPNAKITRIATPINSLQGFFRIFSQLNPAKFLKVRKEVKEILSSFPKEDDRLFLRFSSDITSKSGKGGGLFKTALKGLEEGVNLLNIFNKFQEFITRRAVFQARLNSIILSNPEYYAGKNLRQLINGKQTNIIRKQDVSNAVDAALEITYAKSFNSFAKNAPYERTAGKFIEFVNSLPFIATSLIPFPRFMMNSLRFHFDFSPLGILNFLNKAERSALARGDTSKLSRAVLGITMLTGAYYLRHQDYAGEKWYELKLGGKTIDTRAYNPFAAYLFVGDLLKRYNEGTLRNLDLKGFASVFFGTRAGTGLYLIDKLIDGLSGEKVVADPEKIVKHILGQQVSAFLTPLNMFNDFMTLNDESYSIVRNAKSEKWGEVIKKVSPHDLPPIYSATSIEYTADGFPVAKTIKREHPVIRQLTGFTVVPEKNSAEKELDRLGISYKEIFISTGIAELDKAIKMELAPMIAIGMSEVVEQDWYKSMSVPVQTLFLKTMLQKFKSEVRVRLPDTGVIPYLLEYKLNTMPNDKRKVIDEILGKDFIPNLIDQQHQKYKTKDKKSKVFVPLPN